MMLTYSQQPEYRRVVRRRRDKRDRAELHAIRAAVRSKKPITSGPNVPRHKGAWSVEDEAHAVRLRALGFALDQIALVIQRTTGGVERRLWLVPRVVSRLAAMTGARLVLHLKTSRVREHRTTRGFARAQKASARSSNE
jgi:hypothetical protein